MVLENLVLLMIRMLRLGLGMNGFEKRMGVGMLLVRVWFVVGGWVLVVVVCVIGKKLLVFVILVGICL